MTRKEYAAKKESIEYGKWYGYLTKEDRKELRRDVKNRPGKVLSNTNGKATERAENGLIILTSYYTDVVSIDIDGNVKKLWDGYSNTTMKHINEFLSQHGKNPLSKYEWIMMNC